MNRIDDLLEKYFAGKTSLQEEKELKTYYKQGNIIPAHQKYAPLFQAFENEREIISQKTEIKSAKNISLRQRIMIITSSVAAACLLILFIARYQTNDENYMIVHGKRINNSEMARNFANAKIEKSLNVIHKSLASYKDNKLVREKLNEIEKQIKIEK
ncbi:conserved hypothetical protein [uncultured Paludibacter sp.]|uniref:Uncharacterized protein n=1 Tax=uncultured Paludibacter sp. TaxID=497635 RepID=A0A653AKM2_9BACT|nr:conserved hypothetical protein [uncultured Paludibacter sp.]